MALGRRRVGLAEAANIKRIAASRSQGDLRIQHEPALPGTGKEQDHAC
ncbi:MAG TPA: hypothetical protein VMK84_16215 [Streptosporangiaceae bacterium]|nr:hypothetical protein [Streptosporangiaceae bacterium]